MQNVSYKIVYKYNGEYKYNRESEICLSWGQHFAVLVHMTNVLHTRAMVKGIQEWTK